jgi:hypothetical protein
MRREDQLVTYGLPTDCALSFECAIRTSFVQPGYAYPVFAWPLCAHCLRWAVGLLRWINPYLTTGRA